MKKLILASGSPRRKEIMQKAGYTFEVVVSDAAENEVGDSPVETVKLLARRKAEAVFKTVKDSVVLSADTVVVSDGVILGKPKDEKNAFEMLSSLSDRVHTVYTGVCVMSEDGDKTKTLCEAQATEVYFDKLSKEQIDGYINTGEPMDKAGAYGIQGLGGRFVLRIEGDYDNVVGLPMNTVKKLLKEAGIEVLNDI